MPITPAQAALVDAGTNLAGNIASSLIGINQARINRQFNREEAQKARDWSYMMWQLQNEYDSPKAKMQRLVDAGLNPNLAYGSLDSMGNPVGTSEQAHSSSMPSIPNFGGTNLLQADLIEAQIENLRTQNDNNTRITDAQIKDILGNTPYKKVVIDNLKAQSHLLNRQSDEVLSRIDLNKKDLVLKNLDENIKSVILDSERKKYEWLEPTLAVTVYELLQRGEEHTSTIKLNDSQRAVNHALINYYNSLGNQSDSNAALLDLQKTLLDKYGDDQNAADIVNKLNVVLSNGVKLGPISFHGSYAASLGLSTQPFKDDDVVSKSVEKGNIVYHTKNGMQYKFTPGRKGAYSGFWSYKDSKGRWHLYKGYR